MATPNTESSISNRDKFVLAKAWVEGLVIPGVKLKPGQACKQVELNIQTFWYYLKKEKSGTADTVTAPSSSSEESDISAVISITRDQKSSPDQTTKKT